MCSNHVTDFNEVVAVVVRKKRQEKEESDTCLEKIPVSRLFLDDTLFNQMPPHTSHFIQL